MALSQRYRPSKPPGEVCQIGIDLSLLLPPGLGLASGNVTATLNTQPPTATTDLTFGTITFRGRAAWCQVSGGNAGSDYAITWTLVDSQNNSWPRTVLLACAATS